jgi:aldehyde dehydrogenase (NAD+)
VTLKSSLRSGAILVNETLMSAGCFVSPFGGIGTSGFGNYHSKWSINTFTHERAVLKQPMWAETLIKARYFPYSSENLRLLKSLSSIPEIPYDTIKSSSSYAIMLIIGIFIGKYFF